MQRLGSIEAWRGYADDQRRGGRRIGLVATMGALHDGHASLVRAAQDLGDVVVLTIFVNPRQFDDTADLAAYPRTPERDRAYAESLGVDCLVEPTLEQMWPDYPDPSATTVSVRGVGDVLEGAGRSGHFAGVASVVAKLLAITGPCRAYFGEKDFQQIVVVTRMVRDLAFDVEVVGCPIVRDERGLALSSRNRRLDAKGRDVALALSRALARASERRAPASELRDLMRDVLVAAGVGVDYAEVVDPLTLAPSSDADRGPRRALLAGVVDGVRLIDNGPVTLEARSTDVVGD